MLLLVAELTSEPTVRRQQRRTMRPLHLPPCCSSNALAAVEIARIDADVALLVVVVVCVTR